MSENISASVVTEHLEMLEVQDPRYPSRPHHLLLVTKATTQSSEFGDRQYRSGKFEVRAEYLQGPMERQIGHLVSMMGGELSWKDSVRLSNGEVMMRMHELRGLHIGSFIFNRVVRWAKAFAPELGVVPLKLSSVDATEDNRERRNRLYRKFGLRLQFDDKSESEGRSASDMKVGELVVYPDGEWKTIQTSYWMDGWREFQRQFHQNRDQLRRLRRTEAAYRHRALDVRKRIQEIANAFAGLVSWIGFAVFSLLGYWAGSLRCSDEISRLLKWIGSLT